MYFIYIFIKLGNNSIFNIFLYKVYFEFFILFIESIFLCIIIRMYYIINILF